MGNFSTLYDAIVTRIETVLPSHTRLPNPYKINENAEPFLRQGWGIALGGANNTNRELACRMSIARTFDVSIVRKFYSVEGSVDNKETVEKQLVEDQILLIKDFCDNTALPNSFGIVNYDSDGGIEYVSGERDNYLVLRTSFNVEYFESI